MKYGGFCFMSHHNLIASAKWRLSEQVKVQLSFLNICCCSASLSCLTLSDPMDCTTPEFLVLTRSWSLLKFMSIELMQSVILFCSCLQSCPASESSPMSQLCALGGQSIASSASASVLSMNVQDWFPLGLTDLISLGTLQHYSSKASILQCSAFFIVFIVKKEIKH